MIENSIFVKLDKFDGPLALLLHLVQKDEIDIKDLSINDITEQYLTYLKKLRELNFDVAGEYLHLAATLLHIKSKSAIEDHFLQKREMSESEQELPFVSREQLIERLQELAKFQALGKKLMELPRKGEDIFVRPKVNKKALQDSILTPLELNSLTDMMMDYLRREKRKFTVMKKDRLSIKEKLRKLKETLNVGERRTLKDLIDVEKGRDDIVITFISLLELARLKKVGLFQGQNDGGEFKHGEIYVDVIDTLESFDVESANGFDEEEANKEADQEEERSMENNSVNKQETGLVQ